MQFPIGNILMFYDCFYFPVVLIVVTKRKEKKEGRGMVKND